MSAAARRLLSFFVAPDDAAATACDAVAPASGDRSTAAAWPPEVSGSTSVAVLGPPAAAVPLAASLALRLAARARARCAVAAAWGPGCRPGGGLVPRPRAARTAAALRDRGHDCRASGRLVWLALPGAPERVAGELARAVASARVPAAIAISAPRSAALDELLRLQDAIVLAGSAASGGLGSLALDAVAALGVTVVAHPGRPGPLRGTLACSGLAPIRGLPELSAQPG